MTIIYAATADQHLIATILPKIAQSNVDMVRLSVSFDSPWNSVTNRRAVFTTSLSAKPYEVILSSNGDCLVPYEVLEHPCKLYITVKGTNASGATKSTTRLTVKVLEGTPVVIVSDPYSSVYEQLLRMNKVLEGRMNTLETGSTVEGSEVMGIRTGADGIVYDTAGDAVRAQINNLVFGYNKVNRNNITQGYYVEYSSGARGNKADYFYTSIPVRSGEKYYISNKNNVHIAFFNGEQSASNYISGVLNSNFVTVPDNAILMTVSANVSYIESLQIFTKIINDNIFDGEIGKEKLSIGVQNAIKNVVIVGKNGDYTSVLQALIANQSGARIYVQSGTYNIVEEYTAIYGEDYFDKYEGYSGSPNKFDAGLYLSDGCDLIGMGEVNISFNYQGDNEKVKRYFSPLNTTFNNVVENINFIIAKDSCRYIIHDDFATESGTNIFRNCIFKGASYLTTSMGCGMGIANTYIIENCYFEGNTGIDIAYHNNVDSGENKVIIKNCYCTGSIRGAHYGASTTKSKMIVSGCSASNISLIFGDEANYPNQNIELLAWNNTIRSAG